jgi:broad specificity phosphatase PhoE
LIVYSLIDIILVIAQLRHAGHIIYVRHGVTQHSQRDMNRENLNDCSLQRNLSEASKKDLQLIAQSIRQLNIPIGKVSSSPYCRCRETSQILFGYYEIDPNLQFSISMNQEESRKLADQQTRT